MQSLDVSRALTPLPLTESPPDRRKHVRYKAKAGALVSPVATNRKYWKILDVSLGGMSFRYFPSEDLNGFREIDIVTQDLDFALEGIPFRVISTCEFTDRSASVIELRRCGVEFGSLTHLKESLLAEFIRRYTLSQEPGHPNQVGRDGA
jgi:c-di-GMP-binding flagellar brake protein YcgR